jgi:hypothetical protein
MLTIYQFIFFMLKHLFISHLICVYVLISKQEFNPENNECEYKSR